jgi:hypothetical protein
VNVLSLKMDDSDVCTAVFGALFGSRFCPDSRFALLSEDKNIYLLISAPRGFLIL